MQHRIKLFEYQRVGWTYHAKGLWYTSSASMSLTSLPFLTMVGSPNYGYRSVFKDLETQITILSNNRQLQQQLGEEQSVLYKQGQGVNNNTFQQEGACLG
jgi:CDP-diacylglycerol--glycerol-3-phosphate 3-phosphatidyltransferase